MDTLAELRTLYQELFEKDPPESNVAMQDLGHDDLDNIDFVLWIEEKFQVHVPDDVIESFGTHTLARLVFLIENLTPVAPTP